MPEHLNKLRGVFAPVITPFRDDQVMLDLLRTHLRRLRRSGLSGYLALGSNGEYKSLTDAEQRTVLQVFAEEKGDKVVMVGTGCESTMQTIEKSRAAAHMGFDFVSVLPPSYFAKRMDGPTLLDYYRRIADQVPIPVVLYNAPGFAGGVSIPVSVILALSHHPNIFGMKDSSPAGPAKVLSERPSGNSFNVLAGSANTFYPSLHLGAQGGVLSLTNLLPEQFCRLYTLFQDGHYPEALALHTTLTRLTEAISGSFGVAGVKAAMQLMGCDGGEPRHPLKMPGEEETARIKTALTDMAGIAVK